MPADSTRFTEPNPFSIEFPPLKTQSSAIRPIASDHLGETWPCRYPSTRQQLAFPDNAPILAKRSETIALFPRKVPKDFTKTSLVRPGWRNAPKNADRDR
ncbi:MAG TPA: hypothetical protein PLS67_12430 [Accumulibacter sp.]|jgi:hypothetical protein|nr:hypothetical protein [Accumulibacter sp.]